MTDAVDGPEAMGGGARTQPDEQQEGKASVRTWVGGGGMPMETLECLSVPKLRELFLRVFGSPTASNNRAWLVRKLSDPPDPSVGRGRLSAVRKRDRFAQIWTTGDIKQMTRSERAYLHQHGQASAVAASPAVGAASQVGATGPSRSTRTRGTPAREAPVPLAPCDVTVQQRLIPEEEARRSVLRGRCVMVRWPPGSPWAFAKVEAVQHQEPRMVTLRLGTEAKQGRTMEVPLTEALQQGCLAFPEFQSTASAAEGPSTTPSASAHARPRTLAAAAASEGSSPGTTAEAPSAATPVALRVKIRNLGRFQQQANAVAGSATKLPPAAAAQEAGAPPRGARVKRTRALEGTADEQPEWPEGSGEHDVPSPPAARPRRAMRRGRGRAGMEPAGADEHAVAAPGCRRAPLFHDHQGYPAVCGPWDDDWARTPEIQEVAALPTPGLLVHSSLPTVPNTETHRAQDTVAMAGANGDCVSGLSAAGAGLQEYVPPLPHPHAAALAEEANGKRHARKRSRESLGQLALGRANGRDSIDPSVAIMGGSARLRCGGRNRRRRCTAHVCSLRTPARRGLVRCFQRVAIMATSLSLTAAVRGSYGRTFPRPRPWSLKLGLPATRRGLPWPSCRRS